ncbi:hypothetical protein KIW84_076082 [Lathyrus oleraceus]|uniref:PB1-like domain-containing protein n=1 Tax=Pisum sativum TaxID=3888 RepID=A0A9D4VVJ0_PEA|nr:hypothetical protein KIW84_076082 [Pisum sativum]
MLYYLGGHEHIVDIDPDKWSFFEATGIVKDLCQLEYLEYWLWWYNNESDIHIRMVCNSDANEVYKFVVEMKCVMDIYVEHKDGCVVNDDDGVVNIEDGVNIKDDGGVNDEANGISFDDNKDKRAIGLDDGFDLIDNQSKGGRKSGVNDEIETNYASDELGNSDPDALNQESGPKYPRSNYFVGITMNRAWKEKKIAKDLVEAFEATQPQPNVNDVTSQTVFPIVKNACISNAQVAHDYGISDSQSDYILSTLVPNVEHVSQKKQAKQSGKEIEVEEK